MNRVGADVQLRGLVSLVQPEIARATRALWAAQPAAEVYRSWLEASFDLVRATSSLLTEAVAESARAGDAELVRYFAEQLRDEYGHERWLQEDYAAIGGDPRILLTRVPSRHAARLAGAQYYYLKHAHPVTLLGHIAVLEWTAPRPGLVSELRCRTRYPWEAFRTLQRHSELDAAHGELLEQVLAKLDLTAWHCAVMRTSALTTADGLLDLLTELGGRK